MEQPTIHHGPDCYPWRECFIWWPWATTITGRRLFWRKAFKRRVWISRGSAKFHITEPETQYATLFDILQDPYSELKEKQHSDDVLWGG
jgi:hypothetical protein